MSVETGEMVAEPALNGTGGEHKAETAVTSTSAEATANGATTANDEKKCGNKKEKKEKKEKVPEPPKEPPKTLKEDPADWLKHHAGSASHKANYDVLAKLVVYAYAEEEPKPSLPGKVDSISSSQFVAAFADGQLAAKLVKKASILSAIPTFEGEEEAKKKENQVALLQTLVDYAGSESGIPAEKVFSAADVQDAKKSAYPALFSTLIAILGKKEEIDVDQLAADAIKYAEDNSIAGKAKSAFSSISHSISNLKLSLHRKKSSGDANGVEAEKVENGVAANGAESSNAPNGTATEESKKGEQAANGE